MWVLYQKKVYTVYSISNSIIGNVSEYSHNDFQGEFRSSGYHKEEVKNLIEIICKSCISSAT